MTLILYPILFLATLGSLICWIMVLIKLFQKEGVLFGILGIICALYAFIWGWMKAAELNIKNLMLIWTGCIAGSVVVNILVTLMTSRPTIVQ